MSSDFNKDRMKRVRRRTMNKISREATIDTNIPVHRSEIEIVMTDLSPKNGL